MSCETQFHEIEPGEWVATALRHAGDGYRLVHITGTGRPDHYEVMASYARGAECVNYRTTLPREAPELPSLSPHLPAAFTYENELQDLFGFRFPGLTINYGGNFLRTKVKLPFTGEVKVNPPAKAAKAAAVKTAAAPPPPAAAGPQPAP
jgi:ech hydrogenase subunit D